MDVSHSEPMKLRTICGLLLISLLTAAPALAGYTAGGTFVVKTQFGTVLDNGGVVCQGTTGDGVGGGCLPFPERVPGTESPGGFVRVYDNGAAQNVAFQVCIDNNGDGICGGPQTNDQCRDQIFFSHNDEGKFFNPLGPLPTTFLRGCGPGSAGGGSSTQHNGYVVLLCQGAHEVDGTAHTHSLSAGSIGLSDFGAGYGDFCGGGFGGGTGGPTGFGNFAAKAYRVV